MSNATRNRPATKPRFIFSLRAAPGLVYLAALASAWPVWEVNERREIEALIRRNHGWFFHGEDSPNVRSRPSIAWVPARLQAFIGEELFHDITWARVQGFQFGDADLKRLLTLEHIDVLVIVGTGISEEGLKQLQGRENLVMLDLAGNRIGDTGIDNLGLENSPLMRVLNLTDTLVTKAKIASLKARFPKWMIEDNNAYMGPPLGKIAGPSGR